MKYIIRTSDTNQFKRCRVSWDFSSKMRMNYQLSKGVEALDFGTAVHAALEVYYDPLRWKEPRALTQLETINAFKESMGDWYKRYVSDNETNDQWSELVGLGEEMLHHYFDWAPELDKNWEPVYSEIEFEVPIPVRHWHAEKLINNREGFTYQEIPELGLTGDYLHKIDPGGIPRPVFFQGRIDLVMRSLTTGGNWIWDHKTAKAFSVSTSHFDRHPQASKYAWALREVLGIEVEGVVFNELRKKAPKKPAVLKNGHLSKNKAQDTTPAIYRRELLERRLPMTEYADFLRDFKGQEYFRRVETGRSAYELDAIGLETIGEAIDMLDHPPIYRNADQFSCNFCQFNDVCAMRFDGSDWEWYLEESGVYQKRT